VRFTNLEKKRLELTSHLTGYPENILLRSESEQVWSPLQIVYHLYISEHYSRLYLEKKIKGKDLLKKSGLTSILKLKLLQTILKSPLKFKAPGRISEQPPDLSLDILDQWNEERTHLGKFLFSVDNDLAQLELFRHPFAGRMNVVQMLDFFEAHFDHHKRQVMNRLLSSQ
jgi:hypothetical protein